MLSLLTNYTLIQGIREIYLLPRVSSIELMLFFIASLCDSMMVTLVLGRLRTTLTIRIPVNFIVISMALSDVIIPTKPKGTVNPPT